MPDPKPPLPPRKPVREQQTPNFSDGYYTELVSTTDANYKVPVRGTLYSTMKGGDNVTSPLILSLFPNLYFLREIRFQGSDLYVLWLWGSDPTAEDTYNAEVSYMEEAITFPAYTRIYTIRRDVYENNPSIAPGTPLTALLAVNITASGTGYTQATGTIGSATVTFVVANGALIAGVVTNEGSGITGGGSITITGDGTGATATAIVQPSTAVLVAQKKIELPQDHPQHFEYVHVLRSYRTIPGPILTAKQTTEFGPTTTTSQENLAGTSLTISSTTSDAKSTPISSYESKIELTNYNAVPGPWLYSYPIDTDSNIGTRVQKRINANGTQGGILTPNTVGITNATIAVNTILTLASQIPVMYGVVLPLKNQEMVTISGDSNTTPSINGTWPATVIDATHISIPVHVTAVAGAGFGNAGQTAPIYIEIQSQNDRQSIEIWSQVDTSTLAGATKTWSEWIDYPWPEVLLGIDYFADTGSSSTSLTGTWPIPTMITWHYGNNFEAEVAIRTARYTGKTPISTTKSFSILPPIPDAVLQIRTSQGELVMLGTSNETHDALSIGVSTTGLEESLSQSVHYKTASIGNVLTNGFVTGTSIGAGVTLKMNASSPSTFSVGATFIASCKVQDGRLGLYVKETVTVTVPTEFPA